mgnify:FL=1
MNTPVDISNVTLKTNRMILRPWRQSDLDDFYEYASVDGVGQMAGWMPHKDKAESQTILDMFIAGKKTFALEYERKVIGSLGIECYNEKQFSELSEYKGREIGCVLSKAYWGQGLMPEAVSEVIRYLFEDCGLDFIIYEYFLYNRQSARVQEKCGFHFLKAVDYTTRMGTVEPSNANIIWKKDWAAR